MGEAVQTMRPDLFHVFLGNVANSGMTLMGTEKLLQAT